MAVRTFLPETDNGLLVWSANVRSIVSSDPLAWGIPASIWAKFVSAQAAYASAYAIAVKPDTRTAPAVAVKKSAAKALRVVSRNVVGILRGQKHITAAQFIELGITVRKKRSRIPVPDHAPVVMLSSRGGRTIDIQLRDIRRPGRARPEHVAGAILFIHHGPTEPTSHADWKYLSQVRRTNIRIDLGPAERADTVWIVARWCNPRNQWGPWSHATSIALPAQPALPTAEDAQRAAA